ncbi:hypothetical protein [Methylomonas sp. AM2-LC]|uniref:hypothetical protein n=1 Tax=Methylomonas sp. AM2-LC TaxID=3153301 RepID=UPI003267F3EF
MHTFTESSFDHAFSVRKKNKKNVASNVFGIFLNRVLGEYGSGPRAVFLLNKIILSLFAGNPVMVDISSVRALKPLNSNAIDQLLCEGSVEDFF